MTNSPLQRDSAVMMSSAMPSAKKSCSGSPLILVKGNTAIDGPSGSGGLAGSASVSSGEEPSVSRTSPTKRMPLRGSVRISRCASPLSPIAVRAALTRLDSVASEHGAPAPDGIEQFVAADHAFAGTDEKFQEVEDLRLDCDLILAAAQLTAAGIEHEVTEMIGQIPNPAGPCQPSARP